MEQETFTDFPEGEPRRADNLVQVRTLEGEPEIVLLHIEVEKTRRTEFQYRMWEYYNLIRQRTRKRAFPVVVYLSPGTGGIVRESYTEELFEQRILTFTYLAIGLPDLKADNYESGDNLVGVALSSLMKPGELRAALRKWNLVRRVLTGPIDESRKILLTNLVEKYLPLEGVAESEYETLFRENTTREVQEMLSIYEERGIEKGIQQGIQQGILQNAHRMLIRLMEARFGTVTPEARAAVLAITDETVLEQLSVRVLSATTLADMNLPQATS